MIVAPEIEAATSKTIKDGQVSWPWVQAIHDRGLGWWRIVAVFALSLVWQQCSFSSEYLVQGMHALIVKFTSTHLS